MFMAELCHSVMHYDSDECYKIEISHIFFPYELGWKIRNEERRTFMQCTFCKGMQCSFRSCSDTLNDTPTCKSPELPPITSTTNDYMYMDTTNEDFSQVISTNRTQEKKSKSTMLVGILRVTKVRLNEKKYL